MQRLGVKRFLGDGAFGLRKLELNETGSEIHLSHFTLSVLRVSLRRHGFQVKELCLDPFYAAMGIRSAIHTLMYALCLGFYQFTQVNVYDALWIIAERVDPSRKDRMSS
jgi:hypothetical protein